MLRFFTDQAKTTGRSETAALAAIKNRRLDMLIESLHAIDPENPEEFWLEGTHGMRESDKNLLQTVMSAALESKFEAARDFLLTSKKAENCILGKHLENVCYSDDRASFTAILAAKPNPREVAFAANMLSIQRVNQESADRSQHIMDYIGEMLYATLPSQALESASREQIVTRDHWAEALAQLAFLDEADLIDELLKQALLPAKDIQKAFLQATKGDAENAFDLLLPMASEESKALAFRIICSEPAEKAEKFIPALMDAASIEDDIIISRALGLANQPDPAMMERSTAAVLLMMSHQKFPEAGFVKILEEMGHTKNRRVVEACRGKPGISDNLVDFNLAVIDHDEVKLLANSEAVDPTLLTKVMTRWIGGVYSYRPGAIFILNSASERVHLGTVANTAIFTIDTEVVEILVSKGLKVTPNQILAAIKKDANGLLDSLLKGAEARQAVTRFFEELPPGSSELTRADRQGSILKLRKFLESSD